MLGLVLVLGFSQLGLAQNPNFQIFKNYFVTGDYVVAGWNQAAPNGSGYATGSISIPDTKQPVPSSVPKGADIVAAYLYWATVEGNQSALVGQKAFFNGYAVSGAVLGNPNAPVSWSSGGCSGAANGSKTMRYYRADVRPYLPLDTVTTSPTFGALVATGNIPASFADSGSNGNTAPFALGASLVVVYRVLSPQVPLNGIVLYDGIIAPSNSASNVTQSITGFYDPAPSPVQKLTQIVANGQANKNETVSLNGVPLSSIYGSSPSFPGIYGNWDNPTWVVNGDVASDPATVSVVPSSSNSGCVSWGAMILSTTVEDTDQDGLLNSWENSQGYTDAVSGQFVALPGANASTKDIFLELDYLTKLDGTASAHSHLPKKQALDNVGLLYSNHNINLHVDLGNVYQDDPYVITGGTGGNAVAESSVTCSEATGLCQFPGEPAIGWKGGLEFFQNDSTLGNFQSARSQSYHYMLFGHSLGAPRSFWSTLGGGLTDPTIPTVVSIVNSASSATVTIKSPAGTIKPGDCPGALPACSDANADRVTITGAISQPALNGVYLIKKPINTSAPDANGVVTTTFKITTAANVPNGTYSFKSSCATCFNEPQLGVAYLGPTSTSGHSDFGGGGDSIVTLGRWGADDFPGCQKDPSVPAAVYCDNQVGTTTVQTGTWAHELGHALSLTHGGTYYNDPVSNPSSPTYDINCKPNFASVMNYLFQVRGFADGGIDYSGQLLPNLNETTLSESFGIGPANSLTRWYSNPNAIDQQIQNTTSGGHYAKAHCDGTPKLANEAPAVRVDATPPAGGALDWNNDLVVPNTVSGTIDINNNGILGDPDFLGFNDLPVLNLQQVAARSSSFGFSQAGGLKSGGGGLKSGGGGVDNDGGGLKSGGGGLKSGGGGLKSGGGGLEQDEDTAHSTVGPPTSLVCTNPVTVSGTTYTGCTLGTSTPGFVVTKAVPLTWGNPGQVEQSNYGQIRAFNVYRAKNIVGSVIANAKAFTLVKTITPVAPAVTPVKFYVDTAVKNNDVYTYFVTAVNKQGAQSGPSNYLTVTITNH